jgi:hypothetical protein
VIATGVDSLNPHHFMDAPPSAAVLALGPQLTFMSARELHPVKSGLSKKSYGTGVAVWICSGALDPFSIRGDLLLLP